MVFEIIIIGIGIIAALVLGFLIGNLRRQQIVEERLKRVHEEELLRIEKRVLAREDRLERKSTYLEKIENSLRQDEEQLEALKKKGLQLITTLEERLTMISGWSAERAREYLLEKVEADAERFFAHRIAAMEEQTRDEAKQQALQVIATAVQRYSAEYIEENAVTSVALPSEDFKGRIIGREGRNIRTFEALTGVEVLVDDTPGMVVLSSFNPLRREVARMALERLIEDGRIHPAQIEEKVRKAKARLEEKIKEEGVKVAFDLGVNLHPELTTLLGKLNYRTSHGQNQLTHAREVSIIAKMLAEELGVNSKSLIRVGLLHDIGKAVDHEVDGAHALISANLAQRYGESPEVVHAIAAHHGDIEPKTIIAFLLQAADTLSAARPGARQETVARYIQRLQDLEQICCSFPAVFEAYAIQAGREVRVIVQPDRADDNMSAKLAYDIARAIENELNYPGEIKVNVIRQTQFAETAH
ncbi:ribonuclease Y [Candidatus Acetothermia bacterium]|jgi:ribonuclease Y|nr:ribonuclease Y [Candidatus Acetothermia bacterium]MCI2427762.1 ribonuclease Y [Candidatus Acetothermia bacterium]MCI2428292.1 ribonuclease Y [Candidatus Acetothermia bacterium]